MGNNADRDALLKHSNDHAANISHKKALNEGNILTVYAAYR